MKKRAKSVARGACSLTVSGRKVGSSFYDAKANFPVSWRGRDAAARFAKRPGFAHSVMALECGTTGKKRRPAVITLVSCTKGKGCTVLGGESNKRVEHRHRGKAAYNRTIAGVR